MTPEEWRRIKAVSAAALERAESDRTAYVSAESGGDTAFEREVHSLLSSMERASSLWDTGAFSAPAAAALLSETTGFSPAALARAGGSSSRRFQPGEVVNGRYRVDALVGEGGMGSVYRVFDTATQRTLALKAIRGRVRYLNLFKIEFRTLTELAHPHLARSYDFEPIVSSADCCFTMDFVEGVNIYDATAGQPWQRVLDLVVQLCRALAYVHNRGVVHRDIKPNNVLVQRDGVVKLLDFGLVGNEDGAGDAMGTPSYLAPERGDPHGGDHRSDLYSLGILMYHLLTRRLPFVGPDVSEVLRLHASAPLAWPDALDVPAWLKDVVNRACAKQPSDRFRSANQVIEAINRFGNLAFPVETAATRECYVMSGRFVGRGRELERVSSFVTNRLTADADRSDPVALIAGTGGVGKSRLLRELHHRLQLESRPFIQGHCFEGAASEYGAMAEAFAQLIPLAESRGAGRIVERYAAELFKIAPDLARSRTVTPSPALTTPEAEQIRLFDAAAGFLAELGALVPFVIVVDDAHWAPQGTIEILRFVRRRIALEESAGSPVRVALVVSYRDDESSQRPVGALLSDLGDTATVVHLQPLTSEAMEGLLLSMFGLESIPRAFAARVVADAAGSPFFLEEVMRGLVENGSVFVEHGSWRTATALGDLEIPPTIVSALRRRLAMVTSPDSVRLLGLLAAYKRPMPGRLLHAIAGVERIDEALYDLSARSMVTTVDGEERQYRTAHDHLRTTIYDDLGVEALAIHLDIARGLERIADAGTPMLSELAHHYWAAREPRQALAYALLAGRAALDVYANEEAMEHLEHALELLPADATERLRTLEQLGDACFLAGRYERAIALLAEVDQGVTGTLDRVRVRRKRAEVLGYSAGTPREAADQMWAAARQLGARRPAPRALYLMATATALARHFIRSRIGSAARPIDDRATRIRVAELATTYLRIAYFSFFGEPLLFFLPVVRAANLADRIPESKEHAQVYSLMAVALAGLGLSERALRYGRDAIQEATRCGSAWHLANANGFHAQVLLQTGRWDDALAHAERAHAAFAACGDHFELAVSGVAVIEALHSRGDLAAATARGREQVAVFERIGAQMIGKGVYTVFGRALAKTGDEDGIEVGRRVLELAERGADTLSTLFARIALGESLLHFGRFDEAIDQLERGLAVRDRDHFDIYLVAGGAAMLVRAYAARMRATGVPFTGTLRRSFERQVRQAARAGRRFSPMQSPARLAQGLAYHFAGRHEQAVRCFDESARLAAALGARLWQADAHCEKGLALIEHDDALSANAVPELESAGTLYAACGDVPSTRRATDLLSQLHTR